MLEVRDCLSGNDEVKHAFFRHPTEAVGHGSALNRVSWTKVAFARIIVKSIGYWEFQANRIWTSWCSGP